MHENLMYGPGGWGRGERVLYMYESKLSQLSLQAQSKMRSSVNMHTDECFRVFSDSCQYMYLCSHANKREFLHMKIVLFFRMY